MSNLLKPDDTRDALRKQGGLLLGLGVLMVLIRKGNDMSDFVLLLVLLAPAVLLYGGGVLTVKETGELRAWQTVYSVFGLIFIPFVLFQFVELLNGNTGSSLNVFWIFAATAGLAFYAALKAGIRFHLLAGSLAAIISWLALWNKIIGDGIFSDIGTFRGLLGIASLILVGAALYIWRENPGDDERPKSFALTSGGEDGLWKASELLTVAGIAAVLACGLGIGAAGSLSPFGGGAVPVDTNWFWDIALLVISLGLVGIAALLGVRGPAYIGAIGLTLFLFIVGLDLNSDTPDPTSLGIWPIALIVLGGLGILLSTREEASQGDKPSQFVQRLRGNGSDRTAV